VFYGTYENIELGIPGIVLEYVGKVLEYVGKVLEEEPSITPKDW